MDALTQAGPQMARPPQPGIANTATGADETATNAATLSSDFEMFLRMLTVQVQNQDPLNPVDSTDYATQLATFSGVEQQVKTNDLLASMATQMGLESLQQASGWIGMEALARAPVQYDGDPVTIRPTLAEDADLGVLLVRNSNDTVVQRIPFDRQTDSITWSGETESGGSAPAGRYRFEVESYAGEELLGTSLTPAFNRIAEVRQDDGTILLRLADGTEIDSNLINGLRAAP